jgi:hypothetical protein
MTPNVEHTQVNRNLTLAFFSMIMVVYLFFSIIAKTKLTAYTFPVNALIWIIIAMGIFQVYELVSKKRTFYPHLIFFVFSMLMVIGALRPWSITAYRDPDNNSRNKKIHNTRIYKTLLQDSTYALENRIIINCKGFEDIALMFHQNVNAYHWCPHRKTLDSLLIAGHQFAAFNNHTKHKLPPYITKNESIVVIHKKLK